MRQFRQFMGWVFRISSLFCTWGSVYLILRTIHQNYSYDSLRRLALEQFGLMLHVLFVIVIFPVLAIIFGLAWWTAWKEKVSARAWGIVASLTYVVISLWPIIYRWDSDTGAPGLEFAIGIGGLIAFSNNTQ